MSWVPYTPQLVDFITIVAWLLNVRRRDFLGAASAGASALALGGTGTQVVQGSSTAFLTTSADGTIDELAFDSTCSLLTAEQTPAMDADWAAVRTAASAVNVDEDGNDDAVSYPDDASIPLVGIGTGVVGIGAPIVQDDTDFQSVGNEEFLLNVLDEYVGSGTVLWDDGHGQFYDSDSHEAFFAYADANGYAIEGTTALIDDLDRADAVVITSPSEAFTSQERDALAAFDGTVVLISQSDFGNFDETANINALASALDAPFRFNDDQVLDEENNGGVPFVPTTTQFNTDFDLFADRPGLGLELDLEETYTVDVVEVTDGDTLDVEFESQGITYVETVRILGIDTPETFADPELPEEWEGIDSLEYLLTQGEAATEYAQAKLSDATIELSFDENEGLRGGFGRLLGYVSYDATGDGRRETLYNREVIADGIGRVYDSGLARHDEFIATERRARARGAGVWAESDVDAAGTTRPDRVEDVVFPDATAVSGVENAGVEVVARASETATSSGAPLAAVDADAGVAVIGAQLVDETLDEEETPLDAPADYDHFQFTAGVIDAIGQRDGEVLVDGGHGQFAADASLSAEDLAFFKRYLEGLDTLTTGYNTLADAGELARGRALLISAPTDAYTTAERAALRRYARGGGSIIVLADRAADRERTNELLAELETPLRVADEAVDDPDSNAGAARLPVTDAVSVSPPAFGSERGENGNGTGRGQSAVAGLVDVLLS